VKKGGLPETGFAYVNAAGFGLERQPADSTIRRVQGMKIHPAGRTHVGMEIVVFRSMLSDE
jgi:hypothetical protein